MNASPPSFPFPYLPSEILHQIWQHALCPHGGLNLHIDHDLVPRLLKNGASYPSTTSHFDSHPSCPISDSSTETKKKDNDDDYFDTSSGDGYHRAVRAQHGACAVILRLNRNVYKECLPLLYGKNKFTFHTDPLTVAQWLWARSARQRGLIRHLGLSRESLHYPIARVGHMRAVSATMVYKIRTKSVIIWATHDDRPGVSHEEDRSRRGIQEPEWAAGVMVLGSLARGRRTGQLRLLFRSVEETGAHGTRDEFATCIQKPLLLRKQEDNGSTRVANVLSLYAGFSNPRATFQKESRGH